MCFTIQVVPERSSWGFPNSKNIDGEIYRIDDFKAYDEDKELKTFRKYKEGSGDELYVLHELYELYECFEVYFNKGELKNIINIYSQGHSEIYNSDYMTAKYILTTGALWKDKIDIIKVHITSKIPPMDLTKRTAYFIDDEHFDKPELYSRVTNLDYFQKNIRLLEISIQWNLRILILILILKCLYHLL